MSIFWWPNLLDIPAFPCTKTEPPLLTASSIKVFTETKWTIMFSNTSSLKSRTKYLKRYILFCPRIWNMLHVNCFNKAENGNFWACQFLLGNMRMYPKQNSAQGTNYQAVAYTDNFHEGGFIQWQIVVICIWCVPFVTSQFDVIFMFRNQRFGEVTWHNMHILLHALPNFMCRCTEYEVSALQVRIADENTLNATTQQFITTKISCCALKQWSKTCSSLRQSNLQLQNEASLMSRRIRAVSIGVRLYWLAHIPVCEIECC